MPDEMTQLIGVLAQEREAILTGDFDSIDRLVSEKTELIEQIEPKGDRKQLRSVFAAVEHNQALLQAAIEGVKRARERLEAVRDVQTSLSVYSPWGMQTITDANGATLSKKA